MENKTTCDSKLNDSPGKANILYFFLQYYGIQDIAVGTFGFLESKDGIKPMNMCIYEYKNSSVEPEDESYHLTQQTSYCILLKTFTFVSQDK